MEFAQVQGRERERRPKRRPPLPEGPFLVVGLGRSGQAAMRVLAERGERVAGVDSGAPDGAASLRDEGLEVHLGVEGLEQLEGARCLVKSPGVPQESPVVAAAREAGVTVIGELELGWRLAPNLFVAVTGTNGKTTTTELVGHLYRSAGLPVEVVGNVGRALCEAVREGIDPRATVVCECSSFQLEDSISFSPDCAVFLNLAPDHLDRHGSMQRYREAKMMIFANQDREDVAVVNGGDPALADAGSRSRGRVVWFCPPGTHRDGCEITLQGGEIVVGGVPLVKAIELAVIGDHNVANAMAAAEAALRMGVGREAVAEGLKTFPGVPHRLEAIAQVDGVRYVNDSKATNVGATVVALGSFEGGVRLILGGSLKGEDFTALRRPIVETCPAVYLIGEATEKLAADLEPITEAGVEMHRMGSLEEAVREAAASATYGETVLLSPACASFDAFADFEERGERFRRLVEEIHA